MNTTETTSLLAAIAAIARRAGEAIMPFFGGDHRVERKADHSPVTEADRAAEALIKPALEALLPGVPVVAEESARSAPPPGTLARSRFWLVDPLDGTKEFLAGRDEFTVNIALVENGRPVLGVVLLPARGTLYAGGKGAATLCETEGVAQPIRARRAPDDGIVVAHSRSHADRDDLDRFLAPYRVADRLVSGSAGKFGLIAQGKADLYPRLGPTMEWDTAAGQAVLEAAGGSVLDLEGRPLAYAKPGFRNTPFIAQGRSG